MTTNVLGVVYLFEFPEIIGRVSKCPRVACDTLRLHLEAPCPSWSDASAKAAKAQHDSMNLCKEAVFTESRLIFEKSCISRTTDAVIVKRCTSRKDLLLEGTEESNDQFRNSKQQVKDH